ncbi:hypothetical protein GF327_08305 [Candidatus Woesearchaeota archaeon]|nr:hypothetical protein [Candidatus Woesearchaeota archaeon]
MAKIVILLGGRIYIKKIILEYSFLNFYEKEIWLIDSLQIFDPFYLSRENTSRTREFLQELRISRPFTFYQLKDRIFTLTKIYLKPEAAVIISSFDCFNKNIMDKNEKESLIELMLDTIKKITLQKRCRFMIGLKNKELMKNIRKKFEKVRIWEEQSGL